MSRGIARSDFFITGLIPLLVDSKAFAMLSKNQRGWATLSNNPTPFSSALGLPVLAEDRYKAGWRREPI